MAGLVPGDRILSVNGASLRDAIDFQFHADDEHLELTVARDGALRTLGLDPYGFLVFPRVITLVFVLPLLTMLADLIGIAGGLLVAMLSLDITANAYLIETQKAVAPWDVFSGCLKTMFFGLSIALIACQRGLGARGGAEGVGRATTSAVVTSLFAIVVLDAIFTVLFNAFGR